MYISRTQVGEWDYRPGMMEPQTLPTFMQAELEVLNIFLQLLPDLTPHEAKALRRL